LGCEARAGGRARKQFFFEKKNQKTFYYMRFALPQRAQNICKIFCFFFKKMRFLAWGGAVLTASGARQRSLARVW
jgi:hypothetical protein